MGFFDIANRYAGLDAKNDSLLKIAVELDVQVGSARGWRQNNFFHQPANDFRGFSPMDVW
jgi:hypothetical protein